MSTITSLVRDTLAGVTTSLYIISGDPTVGVGVPGGPQVGQLAFRSDVPSLYCHTGGGATDWTPVGLPGGTSESMLHLTLGSSVAPFVGQEVLKLNNIDATAPTYFNIVQAWYDNPVPGQEDVYVLIGWNWNVVGGPLVAGQSANGFQIESYVDAGTPIIEAHLSQIPGGTGVLIRPWSNSTVIATGEADLSTTTRFYIMADMAGDILMHLASGAGNLTQIGIGTQCISSANLQIRGNLTAWESASGAVDNKFWDYNYGAGNSFYMRAVNDAFTVAGVVYEIERAGASPTLMAIHPPLGIGPSLDAFYSRTAAKEVSLTSDTAGTVFDVSLRTGVLDIQAADASGVAAGTLANAPHAGDPDTFIPIKRNGVVYKVPGWV